jgi:hypothetical protein
MSKPGPKRRPLAERYWKKVDVRGPDECWPWTGATNGTYGNLARGGDTKDNGIVYAHIVGFELQKGRKPNGVVRHRCDTPLCQNGAHMLDGTTADNNRDAAERGRAHWVTALRDSGGRFLPRTQP